MMPLLTRIANSLFWLGRYTERAEHLARVTDVHFNFLLEMDEFSQREPRPENWDLIVGLAGEATPEHLETDGVLAFLTTDRSNPNSILSCLERARENAFAVREHLSSEAWEELNRFYLEMRRLDVARVLATDGTYNLFHRFKTRLQLFHGVADATLLRDKGWDFLQAGKFLERGEQTARLLQVLFRAANDDQPEDSALDFYRWMALLKACTAYEAYRRAYQRITPQRIADLLLLNPEFPRSASFCAHQLHRHLERLTPAGASSYGGPLRVPSYRVSGSLWAQLRFTHIEEIWPRRLQKFVAQVLEGFEAVGNAIEREYFAGP